MKLYTKAGDKGKTALLGGGRVSKAQLRVIAYGEVDELAANIGLLRDLMADFLALKDFDAILNKIQNELFLVGSELACLNEQFLTDKIEKDAVSFLEENIDLQSAALPELKNFVLPGGHILNSHTHIVRCVCRRTERAVVSLADQETVRPCLLSYLNRLSDWLFITSRTVLFRMGKSDEIWKPPSKRDK